MRTRLPNADLRALLGAWLLVCASGWALMVALAVYAFERDGAGAVGAVIAARLVAAMVAAPITGGLLDRVDRRTLTSAACAAQAICLGVAALLMADAAPLWAITATAVLSAAAATAPRPGLQAMLPALAGTPDELTVATAAWSAADNTGFLLGSGAGGVAIAAIGPGAVVAVAAACAAVAAALSARIPSLAASGDDADDEPRGVLGEVLAGLRTVVRSPMLRVPFALFAGLLMLEGTTDVQLVSLSFGKLGLGRSGPGLLYGVWGVGGVVASAATLAIVRRRGYGLALWLGAIAFGAAVALAGIDGVPVALAMMVLAGVGFALVETALMAIVPRLADDTVAGRVYAVAEVIYAGAAAVGALVAPALIAALGTSGSLVAVGAAFGAGAVVATGACRALDVDQQQAGRIRTLLHGVPFLTPLPLPRLERLVRAARPLDAAPETTIVRAGEHGDEFFAIEHGTVTVDEYGRRQGPGTGFGEIALLRDVPRTATVRAIDEVRMWVLDRATFLAAVTGHADASRVAAAAIDEHLGRPVVTGLPPESR